MDPIEPEPTTPEPTTPDSIDPSCPASEFEIPTKIDFNDEDDLFCRESVEMLVSQYDENYEGYLKIEEDRCNWIQLILSSMRIKGVQLVDNREFLEYMRTQINDLTFGYGGFGTDEPADAGELT